MKHIEATVSALIYAGARMATKYVGPSEVVRATRRGKLRKNSRTTEIVLTIGQPNYRERVFIKKLIKAGEPFPVRKVQIKLLKK